MATSSTGPLNRGEATPLFAVESGDPTARLRLVQPLEYGPATLDLLELQPLATPSRPSAAEAVAPDPHLRHRLVAAALSCSPIAIGEWLVTCLSSTPCTYNDLHLRLTDSGLELSGEISFDDQRADFLLSGELQAVPPRYLRFQLADVLVFGPLNVPAPELGLGMLTTVGAADSPPPAPEPAPWARLVSCSEALLDPLGLVLLKVLPANGWRLPDLRDIEVTSLEVAAGGVSMMFHAVDGSGKRQTAPARLGVPDRTPQGAFPELESELLRVDDTNDAIALLMHTHQDHPEDQRLSARAVALLVADPEQDLATWRLLEQARTADPDALPLLLAEAVLRRRNLDHDGAARCYRRAADLAAQQELPNHEFFARLAAGRCTADDDPEAARTEFERAAVIRDDHRGVLAELTHLCADLGDWARLIDLRRRQIALSPSATEHVHHHLAMGEIHRVHLSDVLSAQQDYQAALDIDADCEPALRGLVEASLANDDIKPAVSALDRLSAIAGVRGDVTAEAAIHLRAASLYEHLGEPEQALSRLERANELQSGDSQIQRRMAAVLTDLSRYEEAAEILRNVLPALRERADRADVHRRLADLYLGPLCDPERSAIELNQAIELESPRPGSNPADIGVFDHLTPQAHQSEASDGRDPYAPEEVPEAVSDQAWRAVADSLRRQSRDPASTMNVVDQMLRFAELLQHKLDRPLEALALLEETVELVPEHDRAACMLADVAYQQGHWQRAKQLYDHIGHIGAGNCALPAEELSYRRGVISEALGDLGGAEGFYAQTTAVVPDHREAIAARARLAIDRGDSATAIDLLVQACALTPVDDVEESMELHEQIAALCIDANDFDRAQEHLAAVLLVEPHRRTAVELQLLISQRTRDFPAVSEHLRMLISLTPDPISRADLLNELADVTATELSDPDEATDCLLRAYDVAPQHLPTLWSLIDHYWKSGDFESVVQIGDDLDEAIAGRTDKVHGRYTKRAIANLLARDARDRAVELARKALETETSTAHLLLELAHAVQHAGVRSEPTEKAETTQVTTARLLAQLARDMDPSGNPSRIAAQILDERPNTPGLAPLVAELDRICAN